MNIDDIDIRKTVVHGVNKVDIIDAEMSGYESPTSQVFSRNAPRGPCLLYTSPSPRDKRQSRMPSSA